MNDEEQTQHGDLVARQVRYEEKEEEARRARNDGAVLRRSLEETVVAQTEELEALRKEASSYEGRLGSAEVAVRQMVVDHCSAKMSNDQHEW